MPDGTGSQVVCVYCRSPRAANVETQRIHSNVRKFRHEVFTVWRCGTCRAIHAVEAIDYAHYYDGYLMQQRKPDLASQILAGRYLRLLRRHGFRKGDGILDYGCGNGEMLLSLRKRGVDVSGYDPYTPGYDDPSVVERRYAVVTSQHVIEHLDDPFTFIELAKTTVAPRGLLLIGCPNAEEIDLTDPEDAAYELHQPFHRHIPGERQLIDIVRAAGFEVVEVQNRYYWDSLVPWINMKVLSAIVRREGNMIDLFAEGLPLLRRLRYGLTPILVFYAHFGYFLRRRGAMTIVFRRVS